MAHEQSYDQASEDHEADECESLYQLEHSEKYLSSRSVRAAASLFDLRLSC